MLPVYMSISLIFWLFKPANPRPDWFDK